MAHTHKKSTFHASINLHGKHDEKYACKICRVTKRTQKWVIYNMKDYLNPRWRLVMIDVRSKSCMCCILETGLMRNFAADLSLYM